LSNKFSLERLAAGDEFLLKHPIFNKLNSYLKAFDVFNDEFEKYEKIHKGGEQMDHWFRNFGAEFKLHKTLWNLLENVTIQIGNVSRDWYLQRC